MLIESLDLATYLRARGHTMTARSIEKRGVWDFADTPEVRADVKEWAERTGDARLIREHLAERAAILHQLRDLERTVRP